MPSLVTMQGPNARIIRIVLNDYVRRNNIGTIVLRRLQDVGISSRRIRRVDDLVAIIGAEALIDDEEIVAVEVHRVGGVAVVDVVIQDDAD